MKTARVALKKYIQSDRFDSIPILLISINFAVLMLLMFKAYISCSLNGLDVGVYNQILHNLTAGSFAMDTSLEWDRSHFAIHNQSILYLFFPIYALFPSVLTLGVIQVLILSFASFALYKLSLVKLGNKVLSLLVLIAFLIYQYSWEPILVTYFHPEAFTLFALIAAFYFLEKDMLKLCFLFTTLAMMCKENVALVAVTLGIYILFVKKSKAGLLLSLWGMIWFLGNVLILIPLARGAGSGQVWYTDRYSYLGQSPTDILSSIAQYPSIVFRTLVSREKLGYLYALFSPLFFLPVLSPATLLIALPTFLQNLLSGYAADFHPAERDVFPIIAFIFISLVYAVSNLVRLLKWGFGTLYSQRVGVFHVVRARSDTPRQDGDSAASPTAISKALNRVSQLFSRTLNPTSLVVLVLLLIILLNVGNYPLFLGDSEMEQAKKPHDTGVASHFEIPYLEQFGASQSCREVVLYLAEQAAPTAVLTVPGPLLGFSSISGRSRVYDYSRRRQEHEADYWVIPRTHVSTGASLGYELALDTTDFAVLRKKGIEVAGASDVPSAPSTTTTSGDVPPIDFFDLSNASIQGALFVTQETWSLENDRRKVIFEYPQIYNIARVTYAEVPIPEDAGLKFGIGMNPEVWDKAGDGVLFEVTIDRQPVFRKYIDPKHNEEDRKWHDFEIELAEYAGQIVEISFLTAPNDNRRSNFAFDWAGWANPKIVVGPNPQRVYDFIANISQASSVNANVDSAYHLLARHRRRVLLEHPTTEGHPAELTYGSVFVPSDAFLQFAIGMQTEVWDKAGDGARFEILVDGERIFSRYIDPKHNEQDRKWHDFEVSLEEYAEQEVEVTFLVAPNEDYLWDWATWADPYISVRARP